MQHAQAQAGVAHQDGVPLGQARAGGVSISLVQHRVLHVDDMWAAAPALQLALLLQTSGFSADLPAVSQPQQAVLLQKSSVSFLPAHLSGLSQHP